jgi:hypothetical protein
MKKKEKRLKPLKIMGLRKNQVAIQLSLRNIILNETLKLFHRCQAAVLKENQRSRHNDIYLRKSPKSQF